MKQRGIYEKVRSFPELRIRFADEIGRIQREKIPTERSNENGPL